MKKKFTLALSSLLLLSLVAGCNQSNIGGSDSIDVSSENSTEVTINVSEKEDNDSSENSESSSDKYQTSFEDYPIIDLDPDQEVSEPEFDDSVKYNYNDSLTAVCGMANKTIDSSTNKAIYTTGYTGGQLGGVGGVLLTNEKVPFGYGTISVDVTNTTTYDSGIVFGLTGNGTPSYWESDCSYYLFFISGSLATLGSINHGVWTNHTSASLGTTATLETVYNLKVIKISNKVLCYVNDKLMFGYKLDGKINGTGYGVRSWASAVQFSNLNVSSEYLYSE